MKTIYTLLFLIPIFLFSGCKTFQKIIPVEKDPELVWCYGGMNGSNAKEDPNCQIKDFKFNNTMMTYKWVDGKTMKAWGEKSPSDIIGIACAFYYDEGSKKWRGGKFEYISTSRLTREFGNINTRYGGWEPAKFFAAKKHAFCIITKDGKKRTNIIHQ